MESVQKDLAIENENLRGLLYDIHNQTENIVKEQDSLMEFDVSRMVWTLILFKFVNHKENFIGFKSSKFSN